MHPFIFLVFLILWYARKFEFCFWKQLKRWQFCDTFLTKRNNSLNITREHELLCFLYCVSRRLVRQCFPLNTDGDPHCHEMFMMHIGLVTPQYVAMHCRRLAKKLWEMSGEAFTSVNLLWFLEKWCILYTGWRRQILWYFVFSDIILVLDLWLCVFVKSCIWNVVPFPFWWLWFLFDMCHGVQNLLHTYIILLCHHLI